MTDDRYVTDDLNDDDEDAWPHHRSYLLYGSVFIAGVVIALGLSLLL
ncbi:MAG: hypothetical protein AAAC48_28875 [Phyllobacterium sp.]|jgi:hypothetical protein